MDSRESSLISETSSNLPAPTDAGDSEPGPPVLQDELRLSVSGTKTDSRAGTLHVRAGSSFAWPVFLGNLGLGSGWPQLGSGGPPEGPDVDDDITNELSQIITQHKGKLLSRVLFCEKNIAGVLSDVALIGIGIFWDSLMHCWRIGNVRCDDMMGVMTLFEGDQGGHSPPWWPGPSSCLCSVLIKDYYVDMVVSYVQCSFGAALYDGCYSGGRCDGLCGNVDSPGGDRLERSGWLPIVMQWAGLMAPPMSGVGRYCISVLCTPGGFHSRLLR